MSAALATTIPAPAPEVDADKLLATFQSLAQQTQAPTGPNADVRAAAAAFYRQHTTSSDTTVDELTKVVRVLEARGISDLAAMLRTFAGALEFEHECAAAQAEERDDDRDDEGSDEE